MPDLENKSLTGKPRQPARIQRPPINKVIVVQCFVVIIVAVLCWQWDAKVAFSILLGGFIFILPTALFAWRSFRYMGAANARLVANSFYRGQTTKFLLTAVMFAATFKMVEQQINVWILFVSYGLTAVMHLIASATLFGKKKPGP